MTRLGCFDTYKPQLQPKLHLNVLHPVFLVKDTHFLLFWPTYLTAAMMKAMTATPPIVPTMTAIMNFSERVCRVQWWYIKIALCTCGLKEGLLTLLLQFQADGLGAVHVADAAVNMDSSITIVPPFTLVLELDDACGRVPIGVCAVVKQAVGVVDGDVEVRQVEFNHRLRVSRCNTHTLNALTDYSALRVVKEDGGNWENWAEIVKKHIYQCCHTTTTQFCRKNLKSISCQENFLRSIWTRPGLGLSHGKYVLGLESQSGVLQHRHLSFSYSTFIYARGVTISS